MKRMKEKNTISLPGVSTYSFSLSLNWHVFLGKDSWGGVSAAFSKVCNLQ